jgi:alkanesulfonate monooxygenase SsuD/methylene tetrahydromethanopterin reductase-like flavin-dependent oxidoreductase (luciferase family)
MDLCVWPAYERSWSEVVEVSTWGESAGFSGVWYADHFMPQTDDDSPGHGPALECWTVLAAIGATVPRLRLTSMVSPVTIHHPVVLAKRVATVDHITGGGRVVLGIGAGWQVNEHTTYGFELPAPGERVTRFERAVEQIHGLLHDESIPFDPRPASLPLLVGTGSPRMMRITARWADVWNTWGDPAQLAERTAMFLEACHRVGRDPSTVKRSAQAMVFLTDDDRTRDKLKSRAPEGRSLVGGTAELTDLIGTYVESGLDELAIPDFTLGKTPEQRLATYQRLRDEVLAPFM